MHKAIIRIDGQRFGRLTVIELYARKPVRWLCLCDCGRLKAYLGLSLRKGRAISCGCARWLEPEEKRISEMRSRTRAIWYGMLKRCEDPDTVSYRIYGGRGIKVSDEWHDFERFLGDLGYAPVGWSIERVDVNGGYNVENCKWIPKKDQGKNTRRVIFVELDGERLTVTDAAIRRGLDPNAVHKRLRRGWPAELALSVPSDRRNKFT